MAPLICLLYRQAGSLSNGALLAIVAFYSLAKLCEFQDEAMLELSHSLMSGHAAKHLLAACAAGCVLTVTQRRVAAVPGPS